MRKGERRTHCIRGHVRSPENLSKHGVCLLCKRKREKEERNSDDFRRQSATYQRLWRRQNKDKASAIVVRYKYHLEPEEFDALLQGQKGCCAICRTEFLSETKQDTPHVDHDHLTQKVRGLLCNHCNSGLGQFKDNKDLMRKAITYLETFSTKES